MLLASLVLGLIIGYYARTLLLLLYRITSTLKPKQKSAVVNESDVLRPTSSHTTAVVEPKTPQQIEAEINASMFRRKP